MKNLKLTKHKGTILITLVIILLFAIRIFAATTITTFTGDEFHRAETASKLIHGEEVTKSIFKVADAPVFIKTDAGFSSIQFLAPAAVYTFFFGTSPTALRIYITIIVTLALILLAHTISLWFKKSRKVFLLAICIALTLPWLILQGMIFWDTSFAPICFIIAFYAFTKLKFANKPSKQGQEQPKLRYQLLLPFSLVTATYLYLPAAIPAAILYFSSIIYLKKQKIINLKNLIINLIFALLISLPFIIFFLTFKDGNTRTGELSVFYQTDFFTGIGRFFYNLTKLFSPVFLFLTGDPNSRHAIGFFGMLGTLAIIPVIWAIYYRIKKLFTQNEKFLFLISIIGIISGTISSALTHPDAQPHSLRANAAAPFYIILIILGAQKFIEHHPKAKLPVYAAIAISAIAYYIVFFFIYPSYGHQFFT